MRCSRVGPAATLAVAVAAVGLSGCGGGPPMGEVSGKVTFEGKPVAGGRVSFMNTTAGTGGEGQLKDGAYTLSAPLPPGDYKVTVIPPVVREREGGKGPVVEVERPAPDIPQKYRTIGSTDLKATVKAGPNECTFDMKR